MLDLHTHEVLRQTDVLIEIAGNRGLTARRPYNKRAEFGHRIEELALRPPPPHSGSQPRSSHPGLFHGRTLLGFVLPSVLNAPPWPPQLPSPAARTPPQCAEHTTGQDNGQITPPRRIRVQNEARRGKQGPFSSVTLGAIVAGALGACDRPAVSSFADPVHFTQGDSTYVANAVKARLGGLGDERVVFGSILDVDRTATGWAVVDGIENHIVLLDSGLNPLGTVGRSGEGPGEFEAPGQLSILGDTLAVFDWGTGRVSHLGPHGEFLRISPPVGGFAVTFASHPKLGMVFTTASRDHYLLRATEDDQLPIAPIPAGFRREGRGSASRAGFTSNMVAITDDGAVHVLDGQHLALVSYTPDDESARIAFLPEELRAPLLKDAARAENGSWENELMGVWLVTKLDPMVAGRLFVAVRHGAAVGYVLDTASLTATPIEIGKDWHWLRGRNAKYFDGRDLVLDGVSLAPEVVLATTELVPRSTVDQEHRETNQ